MIPSSLYPLVTALLSNILAQVLKTVVYYYRTGKWDFHWVIASGGFPSSHSSTVTALSLSIVSGAQWPRGIKFSGRTPAPPDSDGYKNACDGWHLSL